MSVVVVVVVVVAAVAEDSGWNVESRLSPHDIEVGTKLDSIFLENWL